MLRSSFVLLAASLALASCVDTAPEVGEGVQPIINGESCGIDVLPQTVALIVDAEVDFGQGGMPFRALLCTGTLIAPDTVLTAAHCLDPLGLTFGFGTVNRADYYVSTTSDLTALSGESQALPPLPADARLASDTVIHESFTLEVQPMTGLGNFNDIGLLFLEEPLTDIVPSIVMTPEEAEGLAVGDEVQIAGWGQRGPDQSSPAGTKQCATTNIYEVGDFELQIGNEPETARKCHGDSGGPTFIDIETDSLRKDRVIGATSRAYDESDCLKGGIDTMAPAFYDWIDGHMTSRCESGERSWCDVDGVVPASFYDEEEGGGETGDAAGCGCNGGSTKSSLVGMLLVGLAMMRRRRSFGE